MPTFRELGERIGKLLEEKNAAYGNSFDDAGDFLKLLYPKGVSVEQMNDALCLVRIFDKMKRIATNKDAFGESPYQDIAGYAILGLRRVEAQKEEAAQQQPPAQPQPITTINVPTVFGPFGPIGPAIEPNPNLPWTQPVIISPVIIPSPEPLDLTPKIICEAPTTTATGHNNKRFEDTADRRDDLVERRKGKIEVERRKQAR